VNSGRQTRIEALAADLTLGQPHDAELCAWLRGLPDPMHEKLVRVGLAQPRSVAVVVTLGQLWDRFPAAKACKSATTAVFSRVRKSLEGHFGTDRPIADIGVEQAEGWCKGLADAGLAQATRSKLVHVGKALFARAVRWELLAKSPFESIKPGPQTNSKRQADIRWPTSRRSSGPAPRTTGAARSASRG
jgi:hypothetical protein